MKKKIVKVTKVKSKQNMNLPEELKNEVLLYLNDYVNNLFIYIYDIKKKKVLRKVNKQSSFVQILKDTVEFKKKHSRIHYMNFIHLKHAIYKKNHGFYKWEKSYNSDKKNE